MTKNFFTYGSIVRSRILHQALQFLIIFGLSACAKVGKFFAEKCENDNPNCKGPGLSFISSGGKANIDSGEIGPGNSTGAVSLADLRFGETTTISVVVKNPKLFPLSNLRVSVAPASYTVVESIEANYCSTGGTLSYEASCKITISYTYTGSSPPDAVITLLFDTPKGEEKSFSIPLAGPIALPDFTLTSIDIATPSYPSLLTMPSALVFSGSTGDSLERNLTVHNYGGTPISNLLINLTGSTEFSLGVGTPTPCLNGDTIAANNAANCNIKILFRPTSIANPSAVLQLIGNNGIVRSFTFTGRGLGLNASPNPISFSSQVIDATPIYTDITFSNVATTDSGAASNCSYSIVGDSAITVGDPPGGDGCTSIATSASCTKRVTFTPATEAALHNAALNVVCTNRAGSLLVPLTARTILSALLVSDLSSIDFGPALLGSTLTKTVTFSNNGVSETVTGFSRTLSTLTGGAFAVTDDSACGSSLGTGLSCATTLSFAPAAVGTSTAKLAVNGTRVTSPTDLSFDLAGSGQGISILSSQSSYDAGSIVNNSTQPGPNIIISNPSTTQSASACVLTLSGDASFTLTDNTCASATSLAAGASCSFSPRFAPTSLGTKMASVAYSCTIGGSVTVSLSANSITDLRLVPIAPTAIDLGTRLIGVSVDSVFVFQNQHASQTATNVTAIPNNLTGPWSSVSNTCSGVTLSPASAAAPAISSCLVTLNYNPTIVGTTSGLVSISSAEVTPSSPSYSGIAAKITPSMSTLTLGPVYTGQSTSSTSITITNPSAIDDASDCSGPTLATGTAYTISNSTCGSNLVKGSSCSFNIDLIPQASAATYSDTATMTCTIGGVASIPMSTIVNDGPILNISETGTYNYGNVDLTTWVEKVFTITNSSTVTNATGFLVGTGLPSNGYTLQSTTCTSTLLKNNDSCTATVRFTPSAAGVRNATLIANASDQGITSSRPLTATGTTISFTYAPGTSLNLGQREVLQSGTGTLTLTITNTGTRTATLGPTESSDADNVFSVDGSSTCTGTLTSGSSCTYVLAFTAHSSVKTHTGTFNIAESGGTLSSNQDITLSAETVNGPILLLSDNAGVNSTPAVSPIALTDITGATDNARNIVDKSPASRAVTITVTNSAAATGSIRSISPGLVYSSGSSGTMVITDGNCASAELAPSQSCNFTVTYTPVTNNENTKQVLNVTATSVTTSATHTATITEIRGTSITGANISITAGLPIDFGLRELSTSTQSNDVSLQNIGIQTATGLTYNVTTNPGTVFSKIAGSAPDCTGSLATTSTCKIKTQFAPGATVGAFSGVVSIAGTQSGTNQTFAVKGATVKSHEVDTNTFSEAGNEGDVQVDASRFYFVYRDISGGGGHPVLLVCGRTATGAIDKSACGRLILTSNAAGGFNLGNGSKLAGEGKSSGPRIALTTDKIIITVQNQDVTGGGSAGGTPTVIVCQKPTSGNTVNSCRKDNVGSANTGEVPSLKVTSSKIIVATASGGALILSICNFASGSALSASTISGCASTSVGSANQAIYNSLSLDTSGNRIFIATQDNTGAVRKLRIVICSFDFSNASNAPSNCTSSTTTTGNIGASGLVDTVSSEHVGYFPSIVYDSAGYLYVAHEHGTFEDPTTSVPKGRLTSCSITANLINSCSSISVTGATYNGFYPGLAMGTNYLWMVASTYSPPTLGFSYDHQIQVWKCSKNPVSCDSTPTYTHTSNQAFDQFRSFSPVFDSTYKSLYLQFTSSAAGDGASTRNGLIELGLTPEL